MQCEFKCTNINPPMQDKYTNTITPIQCKYIYTNTIQIQIHRHVWGCYERQSSGRHVSTQLTQIGSNGLRCTVYCTKYKYIYTDTNTNTIDLDWLKWASLHCALHQIYTTTLEYNLQYKNCNTIHHKIDKVLWCLSLLNRDSSHVGLDNSVRQLDNSHGLQVKQARKPRSHASRNYDRLTDSLTGVKCRATSVANKKWHELIQIQYKYKYNSVERSYVVFGCLDKTVQSTAEN